jgi:hypothetical protein
MKRYTIVFNLFLGLLIMATWACNSSKNTNTSTTATSSDMKETVVQPQSKKGIENPKMEAPMPQLQANDVAKEPLPITDDEVINELPAIPEPKISPEQEAAMKAKLEKEMEKRKKKG